MTSLCAASCSMSCPDARARTGARPRTPRAHVRSTPRLCSLAPLRPPPDAAHLTTRSSSLARHTPLAPASPAPPAIATRVPVTVASHFQRPLASTKPLDSFPKTLLSFSKLEPRHCLTGGAESPSPDFGHLPPCVNRAIW
jgi:hypothetical protein